MSIDTKKTESTTSKTSRPQDRSGNGESTPVKLTTTPDPMDSQSAPEGTAAGEGETNKIELTKITDPAAHIDDTGGPTPPTGNVQQVDAAKGIKSKTPTRNGDKLENGESTVVNNPSSNNSNANGGDESKWAARLTSMVKNQTNEEIDNLLADEEMGLSEEFQTKAKVVFNVYAQNSAVRLAEELLNEIEEDCKTQLEEEIAQITERVNTYLEYSVNEWIKENKVAIDTSLKTEITEEFIQKMKNTFKECYIDIPEDKVDVVKEMTEELAGMRDQLNVAEHKIIDFEKSTKAASRDSAIEEMSEGLSLNQIQKFKELAKYVVLNEDDANFKNSLAAVRGSIVSSTKRSAESKTQSIKEKEFESLSESQTEEKPVEKLPGNMQRYVDSMKTTKL